MGKQVFPLGWIEIEVYRYLRAHHFASVQEIELGARGDKIFDERKEMFREVALMMSEPIQKLVEDHCPIDIDDFDVDIYQLFMWDAINNVNYAAVARAFLEDVELPRDYNLEDYVD